LKRWGTPKNIGVAESVYDGLRNGYLSELEVVK
jgi:hypothetical protein